MAVRVRFRDTRCSGFLELWSTLENCWNGSGTEGNFRVKVVMSTGVLQEDSVPMISLSRSDV